MSARDGNPEPEAEFDAHAEGYDAMLAASLAASGEDADYFAGYKIGDLARRWAAHGGGRSVAPRLLDFGAGVGGSIPHVRRHLPEAKLTCADVSRRSLLLAERRFGPVASFVHHRGLPLPFEDGAFDLAFAACVFHHIPPGEHVSTLGELHRVLRPGGMLLVYEHNPLNPLTRRVVRSCPFDEGAILIRAGSLRARMEAAGFARVKSTYRVFFPRWLAWLRPLEDRLGWLPAGAQYHTIGVKA